MLYKAPDIACLTSLRFFAAMLVFFRHLFFFAGHGVLGTIYVAFFEEGYIGVTFFFVLSGFILTYNYLDKFKIITGASLSKFYQARIARIYPLHFLTFYFAIAFAGKYYEAYPLQTIMGGILNVTLLHGFFPAYRGVFNGPSWSLTAEMIFYFVLPFVLWAIWYFRVVNNRYRPIVLIVGLWAAYAVVVYILRDLSDNWSALYYFPLIRLIDFLIGVLVAVVFMRYRTSLGRMNKSRVFTWLEIGCSFGFVVMYLLSSYVHQSFRFGVYYLPIMTLSIFIFAFQGGKISKWLSRPEWVFLGEISFSFYMIHRLVIKFFESLSIIESQPLVVALLTFVITLVLSALTYYFYENPMRYKIKNLKFDRLLRRAFF